MHFDGPVYIKRLQELEMNTVMARYCIMEWDASGHVTDVLAEAGRQGQTSG